MGYCGNGGSGRRRALMDKFQSFLDNIDESRAVCPEGPCGTTGPCASFGRPQMGPTSTFNSPRSPDYLDPNKRPLITNIQVHEIRPTGNSTALRNDDLPNNIELREVEGLVKWKDRPVLQPQSPETIQRVLANKEKGYPPPGEKNPLLYRSPYPKAKILPPRTFPPHPTFHRAEVPCEICEPPVKGRPKYLLDDDEPELDPKQICPARWSAPCGQQALSYAAACPPMQPHPRFVPDLEPNYIPNPYHIPTATKLPPPPSQNLEYLLQDLNKFENNQPYSTFPRIEDMSKAHNFGMQNSGHQYFSEMNPIDDRHNSNPAPRPGTCGTCMDPKPHRTTCPLQCGEPCPAFHPLNLAFYTDPMEPPICKTEFLRQPPCVDHYNKPCGAHTRLKNNCEEYFGRPCKLHANPKTKTLQSKVPW